MKDTIARLYRSASEKLAELGSETSAWKDAERATEVAKVRALLNHCLRSEKALSLRAALSLAQSEPGIPILPEEMDRDPWLLNVLNGTLDLRTGQLREHRREDLLTKLAPAEYHPDAQAHRWLTFLDRILAGNIGLIAYLQRVVGYSLTGDVREQCLWFCHGKGANGKSTFLVTIKEMLGDYGLQAVTDLLMAKNTEAHPTERADLFGKRFIATIESEEGKRMAEALMKQLTGGDPIRARKMRKDLFEFMPTHKIFLAANHKPVVRGTDHAVWRRIKLIPFLVTIPEAEKDKALAEMFRDKLPGILAWAVQGCLAWQRMGLGEPDEVVRATAEYRSEQDSVQGFLDECCVLDPEAKTRSTILLTAYLNWSGNRFTTSHQFREALNGKGFESKRGHGGGYYFRGIHLSLAGEQVNVGEGNPDSLSRGVNDSEVTGLPSPTFTTPVQHRPGTVIRPEPDPERKRPP